MQRPDRPWNVCNDEDSAGGAVFVTSSGDETVRYPGLRTYDEPLADFIAQAGTVYHRSGKTPAELAAKLADAQAEIARLRGALEEIILLPPHPMRLKSLTIATEALR